MSPRNFILPVICLVLASCGDGSGEWVVIQRKEPDTLLRQGTALTKEEAQRREDEIEKNLKDSQDNRRLIKLESALNAAQSADRRAEVILSLAEIGPSAEASLPAIDRFQKDASAEVRAAILEAHWAIQPETAGQKILEGLSDESVLVRRKAIPLWAQHKPDELGLLVRGLADDDNGVQYAAVTALAAAKSLPQALLGDIAKTLDDMSGSVAKAAFDLLLDHRKDLPDFKVALELALDHQDLTVRLNATEKSMAAGIYDNSYAAKIVQTVMEDPEPAVRSSAYRWLKKLAPPGFPSLDPAAEYAERIEAHEGFQTWLQALAQ